MAFKFNPFTGSLDVIGMTSAQSAAYLKIDQTTPQTTVGLFTFPRIKAAGLTASTIPAIIQTTDNSETNNIFQIQDSTGTTIAAITPLGRFLANSGTATRPGYGFLGYTTTGFYNVGGTDVRFEVGGTDVFRLSAGSSPGFQLASGGVVGWASGAVGLSSDTGIRRVSAGILQATDGNVASPTAKSFAAASMGIGTTTMTDLFNIERANIANNNGGITITNTNTSGWVGAVTWRGTSGGNTYDFAKAYGDNAGFYVDTANISRVMTNRFNISAPYGVATFDGATVGSVVDIKSADQAPYSLRIFNKTVSTTIPVFSYFAYNTGTFAQGTDGAYPLRFYTNGLSNERMSITSAGDIGIGTTSPSAILHLIKTTEQLRIGYDTSNYYSTTVGSTGGVTFNAVGAGSRFTYSDGITLPAGTATAGTAPLKLTSGTVMTVAEAGAIEFTTDDFFATITTGAARKAFILDDGARLTATRVPFATTNGRLTDDADMTFATDTLTVTKIVGSTSVKAGTAAGFISSDGSTGATGSFTTVDLKTVTVKDGIITSIV